MARRKVQGSGRHPDVDSANEFLIDENGREPRPLLPGKLNVPSVVELDEATGEMVWDTGKQAYLQPIAADSRALWDFANLADEKAEPLDFVKYARRWGVLGLCKPHKLPFTHNWGYSANLDLLGFHEARDDELAEADNISLKSLFLSQQAKYGQATYRGTGLQCLVGWPTHRGHNGGREPVEIWRRFARHARAIIRTANRLNDKRPRLEDEGSTLSENQTALSDLGLLDPGGKYPHQFATGIKDEPPGLLRLVRLDTQRFLVERAINDWLSLGLVRPWFVWRTPPQISSLETLIRPSIHLGGGSREPNLFAYLATQLMFRAANITALGTCFACKKMYAPDGPAPKANQRNYCKECRGSGKADRHRAADNYRAKRLKS